MSKPGLEPTTRPQAGRPAKVAAEKLFAVIILKLVPLAGIEPTHPDYKTGPLPLRIKGQINLLKLCYHNYKHHSPFT